MDEFYRLFNATVDDYNIYQTQLKKWEFKCGENSLQSKIAEKQAEVKQREEAWENIYQRSKNRGAR